MKKVNVKLITIITVIDPDSKLPVEVSIFKEIDGEGMFGVDTSFLANTEEAVLSPFGNGVIDEDDL